MLESMSLRPCRCPDCPRCALPGDLSYPYCSGRCASRAAEIELQTVRVLPVAAGDVTPLEAQVGGVIRKQVPFDGLVICKGDGPPFLVSRLAIEAALAMLDDRPAAEHRRAA